MHISNIKKLNFKFNYLPLEESGKKFLPSCTSTYDGQPLCKDKLKSIKRYRRSCAYEVYMSNIKKLNFKFDYLPLEEPGMKFLPSCASTYDAQQLCEVSSKSVQRFRRSCAYEEMWTDGQTDRQTDRQGDSYIPPQTLFAGGIIISL